MKKITLLLAFGLFSLIGNAQAYQWAKKIAGTGSFSVTTSDVIAAGNGDIFVSGKFTGTVDFDPNSGTVSKVAQGTDGFVAAYNPAGELEWVYTTNVAGNEEIPAISFYSPNLGFQITAVVKIGTASFNLVKLSRIAGNVVTTSSTYSASVGLDIKEIDDRGYLVGGFTGSFDLGAGASALDLTNAGLSDGFCIKLGGTASTYTIVETASYGGTGFDIINTLSGEYLAGSFTGSFTLGASTMTSAGGKDGLLFKFNDITLAPLSAAFNDKVGGAGDDEILSIYFDLTGASTFILKIAGYFSGTANFSVGTGSFPLTSSGGKDGFTVGYTYISNVNGLLVDEFIKHGGTGDDEIVDISMDNNLIARYHFVGNTELSNGGSQVLIGSIQNFVVTAYTGNFTPSDATKINKASAVAFTFDNVFYAGEFNATTDFNIDAAATNNLTFTTGGPNMFLQKSNSCVNSATTPPSLSGASAICVGNPLTMYIAENGQGSNINSNLNWKWYSGSCGGTLVGTGSSITVTPTTTTTYWARGEDGCVPNGSCSGSKTVTVYAIPNNGVTLTGNTLTSSQVGNNATYQWIDCNNGNSDIAGATNATFTPTVSGSYAVKVSNPGNCLVTSTCTQVTLCTVASTPTVSGPNAVCSGQSITLSIATGSLNGSTSWKWYSGSCGGTLVGTGTSITVSPTATTGYYVRGEGGCNINGSCSAVKTVTVNALPNNAVTVSGTTLTATQAGATYQWVDCGNGNANIAGATSQSYTPTVSGNFAVKVTSTAGCLATSACTAVTLCTVASTPTVSGSNSVCSGQSITLSIATGTLNDSASWKWYSGSCGGTLVGTGTSITVSPTATTDYYVRGEGGCSTNGSCSVAKTVTVNALPNNAVTVSGTTLTATQAGATYQWVDCNNGNQNITGATSQAFTPTASGNYAVKVTSTSGCTVTSACTQVTICNPASTPTISGDSSVCSGQTVTLTVATGALNGNTSWQWYSGSCGGSPLITGNSIFVSPTATTTYYVRGEGGCATNGSCSAAFTVIVNPLPNNAVTVSGTTLTATQAGATYQWVDCNNGNQNIAGATNQAFTPTASGNYAVKVTSTSGCTVTSACTQVTICTPASTPTISGSNSICVGSNITLSIGSGNLNSSTDWKWYSGSCGGTLVGTGTSITVSPTATTDYYVRGEGGCSTNGGCSVAKTVTVNALPNNSVTLSGNILTATQAGATYQWVDCNNGNQNIAGATSQAFTPTSSGNYAVKVTSTSGCTVTSACTQVNVLAIDQFAKFALKLYPNPAKTTIAIDGDVQIYQLSIVNILGQKVLEFHDDKTQYNVEALASGRYFIQLETNLGNMTTSFIKE